MVAPASVASARPPHVASPEPPASASPASGPATSGRTVSGGDPGLVGSLRHHLESLFRM